MHSTAAKESLDIRDRHAQYFTPLLNEEFSPMLRDHRFVFGFSRVLLGVGSGAPCSARCAADTPPKLTVSHAFESLRDVLPETTFSFTNNTISKE